MANFVALFDANILYPASVRDLLLRLALTDLFRARWTDRIHDQWISAASKQREDLTKTQFERTRGLMNKVVPDCLVTGYEQLIGALILPDANDRHVLAAAIRCNAEVIVTYNLGHFPEAALAPYGIEAQHPDEFVNHLFDLDRGAVCAAVRDQAALASSIHRTMRQPTHTVRNAQIGDYAAPRKPERLPANGAADAAASQSGDILAFSVPEFCRRHGISRAHFYNLIKDGEGPALMRVGRRILISAEAAAEWRMRMQRVARQTSTR